MFDKIKKYDIKPYIDENTTCVIDVDGIVFRVAAIAEVRNIKTINKETKEEHIFKTRTEFFGRSKNKIGSGSWLANRNVERELLGEEPYDKDDWIIEDISSPRMSLDKAKEYIEHYIDTVVSFCKCNKRILLVGGDTNFRDDLELPVKYKIGREKMIKPVYLKKLREWVKTLTDVEVSNGVEADDLLAIYGFKGYRDYLKTGTFSYMVATCDKDAKHTPSLLLDWTKEESNFVHPYFYLIPDSSKDVGDLHLTKSAVKFYGLKGLAYQLLVGDDSDGYSFYKYFDLPKGFYGNTAFYKDFAPLETAQEVMQKLKDKASGMFPDGVEYESCFGNQMKLSWLEWLEVQFQCAYMKRSFNDKMTVKKLFEANGIELT